MTERIERVSVFKERVLFEVTALEESVELALSYSLGARSVSVFGEEQIIIFS